MNKRGQAHLPYLTDPPRIRNNITWNVVRGTTEAQEQSARGWKQWLAPALFEFGDRQLVCSISHRILIGALLILLCCFVPSLNFAQNKTGTAPLEYLWYETEDMRGFATQPNGEPVLNPSWLNLPRAKAPGWAMNGTGTSAEWTQGGESGWNSAAASADETNATIYQDVEIPRNGRYRIWLRYADWANKTETFSVTISQQGREIFRHEFGTQDRVDAHDEVSMYWQWAFTWDGADAPLLKGPGRVSIVIDKAAQARRHIDCFLLTNDADYTPWGRAEPDFAAMRYLRQWSTGRASLPPLQQTPDARLVSLPKPSIAGRDFLMPWNIAPDFWNLLDKPSNDRPLFPFNAEPIDQFVEKYKGARDVPIFNSKLVVPVIYINNLPAYLKEGSPFLRYLRETKTPFAVNINYGAAQLSDEDGRAALRLLNGELKDQFIGWISGESVGYVWEQAPEHLKVSRNMSRTELLSAYHNFYNEALTRKWSGTFHSDTGAMWDKLIPAQSTSSTSFSHALADWGVRLLGIETAAVQPMFAMRTAFTRGAARQYGGSFLYYHAPNFGDTATTFTRAQNFAGPDNFFHSRYGATMGPSLSWYRKSYYFYYMSGASAIYLEQGGDQFFKPGPGEHEFQLNPLGRITDEFVRFAEKHPDRGVPYTPVAFLLDPAHGWDMTDYPQWPFGVSQITRGDRALKELFSVAYYPGTVVQGQPASGDRQAFVNGIFGDVFDVLVASDAPAANAEKTVSKPTPVATALKNDGAAAQRQAKQTLLYEGSDPNSARSLQSVSSPRTAVNYRDVLASYRALVVGGRIKWSPDWIKRLEEFLRAGGTVVLNAAQVQGVPSELTGVRLTGENIESDNARCLAPNEPDQNLRGQLFRYEKIELKGAVPLINAGNGDPLVTTNKVGKGLIVFCALPDLLGEDERMTPFAAHMLAHIFSNVLPLKVTGDIEYLINRNADSWIVTLINNNGVFKPQQGMAHVDRRATVTATVTVPSILGAVATDWIDDSRLEMTHANGMNTVKVRIHPGGISIIELKDTKAN